MYERLGYVDDVQFYVLMGTEPTTVRSLAALRTRVGTRASKQLCRPNIVIASFNHVTPDKATVLKINDLHFAVEGPIRNQEGDWIGTAASFSAPTGSGEVRVSRLVSTLTRQEQP